MLKTPPIPIAPLGSKIAVEPNEPESQSRGGIFYADVGKPKKSGRGKVVAVGPGKRHPQTGEMIPVSVKVGDEVLYSTYSGSDIEVEGKMYNFLDESDILCQILGD